MARSLRRGLLVGQVALTLVIATVAAIVVGETRALVRTPLGFEMEGLEAFLVSPDEDRYASFAELAPYYDRLREEVATVPGVERAELGIFPPLFGFALNFAFEIEHYADPDGRTIEAGYETVSPGYGEALGLRLRDGRLLGEGDAAGAPMVAVVNQALAEKYFPGQNPLGRRIRVMPWMSNEWRTIVGVVEDFRHTVLTEAPDPLILVPYRQTPWLFGHLIVRPAPGAQGIVPAVEAAIRRADPSLAVTHYSLADLKRRQTAHGRVLAAIMLGAAGGALLLAAFGIYALVTLSVTDQRRDIGIRMALGATPGAIQRHYLALGVRTVGVGLAGGIVLAYLGAGALRALVPDLMAAPLGVIVATAVGILAVGAGASLLPARRAARTPPSRALHAG